jgi:hypothetical protein
LLLLNIASHLPSREGKVWVTKSTKETKLFPFKDFSWHSFWGGKLGVGELRMINGFAAAAADGSDRYS